MQVAPVAVGDTAATNEDTPVAIDVVGNDNDENGDTLTISVVTQGGNGMVTTDGPLVTYTPADNFNGTDVFTYTVSDGSDTDTATVTVTVVSINDPPVANGDLPAVEVFSVDNPLDVLFNDDDPVEGDPLIITAVDFPTSQGGTVTINSAGDGLVYTPAIGFFGLDTFNYTIEDIPGGALSPGEDTASVTVNVTAATALVSVDSDGIQGNGASGTFEIPDIESYFGISISENGRFIAFVSAANLVSEDNNGIPDIFVHDRQSPSSTVRVSIASDGTQADGDPDLLSPGSSNPSISADGRFVAFESVEDDLVGDDTNGFRDIFLHDRDADEDGIFDQPGAVATVKVSVDFNPDNFDGSNSGGDSFNPAISASGRYVAFDSEAEDLAQDDSNGDRDVFVHDRDADEDGIFDEDEPDAIKTVLVSVRSDGTQAQFEPGEDFPQSINPSMSADGRFVAFESTATNLDDRDTAGDRDIFVHDRDTDGDGVFDELGAIATQLVSVNQDGDSINPVISADGRYVAFESETTIIVPGSTNTISDIFMHDRDTDENGVFDEPGTIATQLVTVNQDGSSIDPAISASGRFVALSSNSTNLVSSDTNNANDVFEAPNPFLIP